MSPATRALPMFLLDWLDKWMDYYRETYDLSCSRAAVIEIPRDVIAEHSPRMTKDLNGR